MRRPFLAGTLIAFVALALFTPLGGRAFGRACAAGSVHVAVIVDSGSGGSVSALCVPAGSGENGESLLSARASMLGTPPPRYSSSGLLCAIDGFPATGCGTLTNGKFAYWSYWHGSGGRWSYAESGPGTTIVSAGVIEGWRWQPAGNANPSDPAPRAPASATAICPPPAPPPTAAPVPTTVAGASGPGTTIGAPGTFPPATTIGGSVAATVATTPKPSGSTVAPTTTARAKARGAAATSTTDAGAPVASVALVPRGIAAPLPHHSKGGLPVGGIVAAVLVAGLGGAGALVARRRRLAP